MTIWKKYGLGISLIVMFLIAWALMTWMGWVHFYAKQLEHHQSASVFGSSGYVWRWGEDTFSNWQADFFGQGLAVILGAYLIFAGSEQSKDSGERVQQLVQEIESEVRGPQATQQANRNTQQRVYRGGPLRNYGLGIALMGLFLASWILMTWTGWMYFVSQQQQHGQTAQVFGSTGYIWNWLRLTFENWQSDQLGHGLLIVIPAYLLYKGSASSRGGMDRVMTTLTRVRDALRSQETTAADGHTLQVETRQVPPEPRTRGFWHKYGLGIAFLAMFLVSWIIQTLTGWQNFVSDQADHHSAATVFGSSGYVWMWATNTLTNWQSDLLWDGLLVFMGAYLIYSGSAESRDSDDRMEQLASSIERDVRGPAAAREAEQGTSRHVLGDVWHHRGLAYSLTIAGLVAWALMTWTGWMQFASNQHEHGSMAQLFGTSGYIWQWGRLTFSNWQSDILGNAATVILSAYLLYKGSGMSRGSDDEIEKGLQRIQQAVQSRQQSGQPLREERRPAR